MQTEIRPFHPWMVVGAGLAITAVAVYLLNPILMPFLVAALLAYLGDPLADRLEAAGLSRTLAVCVVFGALVLLVAALLVVLIPMLGHQFQALQENLPKIMEWVRTTALPWVQERFGVASQALQPAGGDGSMAQNVQNTLTANWQKTGDILAMVLASASKSSLAFIATLANVALIPVVTFYLLRDWDRLIAAIDGLLPRKVTPMIRDLAAQCDEVLSGFLRGQLLVMLCLGAIYAAGLWLVGLDLALLIGMLAGLANVVPYLGFIVGISAATVAGVFQYGDLLHLALIWGVFLVGQTLEGTVLTPKLVGDRIGLHPVAVIFAIMAGGQLFGFSGILLALPVAAVLMVLLRQMHSSYTASRLYAEDTSEDPSAAQD